MNEFVMEEADMVECYQCDGIVEEDRAFEIGEFWVCMKCFGHDDDEYNRAVKFS